MADRSATDDRASGALVTGGARGLGRAIATRLAQRGDVVTIADVDEAAAAATAAELVGEGLAVRAVELDVTDVEAVDSAVAAIDAATPLETVVNNAGVGWIIPLVDVTPEQFDALLAVNLRGTFFVLQAAARLMIPRGRGSIVNVASTSAFTASTTPMVLYDTSKAAVRMPDAIWFGRCRPWHACGIRIWSRLSSALRRRIRPTASWRITKALRWLR